LNASLRSGFTPFRKVLISPAWPVHCQCYGLLFLPSW
jgi:hypothetical protein